ncbi:MAG: ATP-binding cassette domain-containing protein [Alphaproteobacteria bacterium]|nr:ATP-binding cassette domain-containing protein [Alphaproteobacteria bacterium]
MSASPPILYVDDIHLTHGVTPLLAGASLSVGRDDRICLVGRNGSGKSTLLKIIAGQVEADAGERFVQPGIHVEYLAQDPSFDGFQKAEDFVLQGLMNNEDRQRAFQLMADLHIEGTADIAPMSGGERRRVALAKAMAGNPEVLLLDEPTNHLDLPAIEWLEGALRQINSALILVSHDRRFLSNMANQTVWLDRGETKLMRKHFGHFEDWRDEELAREAEAQHKLDRKIAREEDWLRYGVTARRKRNVKRLGDLHQLRQQRRDYRGPQGDVEAALHAGERSGKLVAKADKINKAYGEKTLVHNFSTQIKRGSRIGLIGPNGAGKTTLLNILLGTLEPDSGNVRLGKNLTPLILDQQRAGIKKDWNVKDALTDGAGDLVSIGEATMHVIGYMKNFLFHPSQMRTPVTVLSGGEQARLFLARGLRQPSNLLVMDEPTNDLDLETLDLLQEMIAAYEGTVILVSHDRDFLDRTVTAVFNAEGDGQWIEYAGGYSDMKAQQKATNQANAAEAAASKSAVPPDKIAKDPDKIAKEKTTPVSAKLSYKHRYRLEKLPDEMTALARDIERAEAALADADLFTKDPQKFETNAAMLESAKAALAAAEEEWLQLEMLREAAENAE